MEYRFCQKIFSCNTKTIQSAYYQMNEKISFAKALTYSITRLNQPVVTLYQISVLVCNLFLSKSFQGAPISLRRFNFPDRAYLFKQKQYLEKVGILQTNKNFPGKSVFNVFENPVLLSAEEIICVVDPFAYISHLSAMEFHGLTDRIPSSIFYSTPPPRD